MIATPRIAVGPQIPQIPAVHWHHDYFSLPVRLACFDPGFDTGIQVDPSRLVQTHRTVVSSVWSDRQWPRYLIPVLPVLLPLRRHAGCDGLRNSRIQIASGRDELGPSVLDMVSSKTNI
jgi:hypothetical protein